MSPRYLNFPVLKECCGPLGAIFLLSPMETAQQREEEAHVQRVCPVSAQRQVFTHFSHPALTPAVLSSLFCTQRMNSGGGKCFPTSTMSWRQQ